MSFRIVVISSKCKLSYKDDYLLVRGDETKMIHLSEIHTLIIDNTMVLLTSYLLCELVKNKIKVIFCDENRNPFSEIMPYYNSYLSSGSIKIQKNWSEQIKGLVFKRIIEEKLKMQAAVIKKIDIERAEMLREYSRNVKPDDSTNREGHGAKVYFSTLFDNDFIRHDGSEINKALNYGYTIILSCFNRSIVQSGYLTQIGIHHKNDYNPFNLSCDFMEPYRPLVDRIVKKNINLCFNSEFKIQLVNILNKRILIDGKQQTTANAIKISVRSILKALEEEDPNEVRYFKYEE